MRAANFVRFSPRHSRMPTPPATDSRASPAPLRPALLAAPRPALPQLFRSHSPQHFGLARKLFDPHSLQLPCPHPHRHAARKPRHLYYTQKPAKCFVGGGKNLPAAGNPPRACRPGLRRAAAPPAFGHLIPLARLAIAEAKTKSLSSRFSAWRMLSLVPSHHLRPSWM